MASPDQSTPAPANGYLQGINLRTFSELEGAERAFASLYLSSPDSINTLPQREALIYDLLADEPEEAEQFTENMKLIRAWLEEHPFQSDGLCVFACWALNYVQGIPLPLSVPDLLRVGPALYLRPLAELQDEYENFVIVVADNRSTRILEVTSAMADTTKKVRGDVTNAVRKGGWSQKRYARRREKELLHYAKEINEVLSELIRKKKFNRIVLMGSQETLTELESVLEKSVAEKVIGKRTTDTAKGESDLIDEAYELFFTEERDEEIRLWDRIKDEYLSDGLAVVGPQEVLDALHLGRVEEIIVTRDAEIEGTRCRDCENLVHGTRDICAACESDSVFTVDLVDELVRRAELTSAAVEFTDPIEGLSKQGDVAALLRY
jgi:peptide subunit release factor 1 (eRF1)